MATSKKDKKTEKSSTTKETVVKKENVEVKEAPKKQTPTKKSPKFTLKEILILKGKECTFVEKLKGKVIVRYEDGTFGSAIESEFSVK